MAADRRLALVPRVLHAPRGDLAREITIDAPRDLVFSYFMDPARHIQWQGIEADLDPRPGGAFRVTFGPGYVAAGQYLEVDPPARLVYTWGWEQEGAAALPVGASTVEITLAEKGTRTVVRLRHRGLPDPGMVDFHGHGWDESLAELARCFASRSSSA